MNEYQMGLLREIAIYLHTEKPNEKEREYALEIYFLLHDSLTENKE